jgi:hypothetical protein
MPFFDRIVYHCIELSPVFGGKGEHFSLEVNAAVGSQTVLSGNYSFS